LKNSFSTAIKAVNHYRTQSKANSKIRQPKQRFLSAVDEKLKIFSALSKKREEDGDDEEEEKIILSTLPSLY